MGFLRKVMSVESGGFTTPVGKGTQNAAVYVSPLKGGSGNSDVTFKMPTKKELEEKYVGVMFSNFKTFVSSKLETDVSTLADELIDLMLLHYFVNEQRIDLVYEILGFERFDSERNDGEYTIVGLRHQEFDPKDFRAVVDKQDENGWTALKIAQSLNNEEMVRLLKVAGATDK